MRILVTGGAGYIGSHAARFFRQRGHEVWIFDNLSFGHRQAAPPDRLIVGDLAEPAAVDAVLRERAIEAVVHFAAFTYVGESVRDPEKYYQNNLVNTLNLVRSMRRCGVHQLVFSSTCATYGIPRHVPITEDEPQQPINPYGRAKLGVEWALADYAAAYGLAYASLRYFNAAGASPAGDLGEDHDPETHLIPLVLQVALGQRPHIEVFGTDYPTPDGTCIRDYIHVDDLAAAHLLALARLRPGTGLVYNLGTGQGYSVRDVIRTCEAVTGRTIAVQEGPRRPGDPPVLVAAAARAMRDLDWQPRFRDLRAIVETAWRWHHSHPHGFAEQPGAK
jgi:UDP-glucose-4-epimerase GalE